MKKFTISGLFLYKYRFLIGYIALGVVFALLLVLLPLISPEGIYEDEMRSAVSSNNLHFTNLINGEIVNLPYRFLQKLSILIFGLSTYSIKLPSIIFAFASGFLLILLLNRWFKNNVALLAAILTTLTTSFLFAAGSGTPLIMYIFWPLLLLWLGSKIFGNPKPSPIICILLTISLAFAAYTPHFIYLLGLLAIMSVLHPHLRFTIKTLPRTPLIISVALALLIVSPLALDIFTNSASRSALFFTSSPENFDYFANLSSAFAPFFSFGGSASQTYLAPLFGIALTALAVIGVIAIWKNLYTSRGAVIVGLIVFSVVISGLDPLAALLVFTPIAILVASGFELILTKWYGFFPENPYARIFALIPLSVIIATIILPDLNHFVYGYHYDPSVANEFNNDLALVRKHAIAGSVLLIKDTHTLEYDFYKILEQRELITVTGAIPDRLDASLLSLGQPTADSPLPLDRIITSPKSNNSDRIYIYTPN